MAPGIKLYEEVGVGGGQLEARDCVKYAAVAAERGLVPRLPGRRRRGAVQGKIHISQFRKNKQIFFLFF